MRINRLLPPTIAQFPVADAVHRVFPVSKPISCGTLQRKVELPAGNEKVRKS